MLRVPRLGVPRLAAAVVVSLGVGAAPAIAAEWSVVPEASALTIVGHQGAVPFEATMDFTADISFDPDDLAASQVAVTIDMTSFQSGAADRDGQVQSADWFNAAAHPQATFVTTGFTQVGDDAYEAVADLTIREATLEVVLPFTLDIDGDTAVMEGAVMLDRTAFGVGQGQFADDTLVRHGVEVLVALTATRVN